MRNRLSLLRNPKVPELSARRTTKNHSPLTSEGVRPSLLLPSQKPRDRHRSRHPYPGTRIPVPVSLDNGVPIPGSLIMREYKGRLLEVLVLDEGFEYAGEKFKSLSAVAKRITGSHCNGYLFFNLRRRGDR
ncbi:MAG: DUF2924 domain-containing protein [Pirellula staleyi]